MFAEPEDHEDDVEVFKDAPESGDEKENEVAPTEDVKKGLPTSSYHYDGRKREPQYANAQNSCLWEIVPLLSHYHPSVALHASQLLYGQNITTKPDLELHTLSHFLDRFVYRNPKKALQGDNNNAMKPDGKGKDVSGLVLMRKGVSASTIISEIPLNNENFAKKDQNEIPVDQLFFHRYVSQKLADEGIVRDKQNKNKRKRSGRDDGDDSDIDSDDEISIADDDAEAADLIPNQSDMEGDDESDMDEDEVWKAMQASMPPAVGDADLMEDDSGSEDGGAAAAATGAAGSEDDDDDISAGEFAYSDSDEDQDAAMDAILAGEDEEASDNAAEEEDEEGDNSDLAEDEDMPSFFPDNDDEMNDVPTFDEDEDDLIGSDEDIILGDNIRLPTSAGGKKVSKNKKQKLKHLPAFASAEDWADLIEGHDSE